MIRKRVGCIADWLRDPYGASQDRSKGHTRILCQEYVLVPLVRRLRLFMSDFCRLWYTILGLAGRTDVPRLVSFSVLRNT